MKRRQRLVVGIVASLIATAGAATGDDLHGFKESYADSGNPQVVVAIVADSNGAEYVLQSLNSGKTWQKMASPDGSAVRRFGRQDVDDYFVDAGPPLTITYGSLWRAGADGKWTKLGAPEERIQKLIPTTSASRFFAVTSGQANKSDLFRTEDGGQTWARVGTALPFECNPLFTVCDVAASADGEKIVAQLDERDGYVSTDSGKTWKPLSSADAPKEIAALQRGRVKHAIKGNTAQVSAAKRAIQARMTGR